MSSNPQANLPQTEQDSRTMKSLAMTVAALCGLMVVLIAAANMLTH